jgi:hypothetical protein
MWHAWERGEMCTVFWWEGPKETPLGKPRRSWEDGVKMELTQIGCRRGRGWIHLARDRDRWRAVVNAVMNLRVLAPQS